jgi:hypothetical protein
MMAKGDPGYFDDPKCPFSPGLKALLKQMLADPVAAVPVKIFEGDDQKDVDAVLGEVQSAIEEFKLIEGSLGQAEVGERIQAVKAKTTLLEKWVSLKEKLYNMREHSVFVTTVLAFMDEILTKDQQQEFKNRLRGVEIAQIKG